MVPMRAAILTIREEQVFTDMGSTLAVAFCAERVYKRGSLSAFVV